MDIRARILNALSRVTSSGNLIPEIDGLRFIAISSVAMYHLLAYVVGKSHVTFTETRSDSVIGLLLDRGWFGVELFFAISGFVISLPFARHAFGGAKAVSIKHYYLRRLTRLEPPYIICITACLILLILVKGERFSDLLPHYLSTVTYTHNLIYGQKSTIATVAWSLEVEIQFYILAPLVAYAFKMGSLARRSMLIGLIAIFCAIQPILNGPTSLLYYAQFFLVGFLLSDLYVSDWKESPRSSYVGDMAALISGTALFMLTHQLTRTWFDPGHEWTDAPWCLAACAALFCWCWSAFRGRILRGALRNPWLVVMGGMCYTIYLYHELVYSLIGRAAMHVHFTHVLWVNYGIAWLLMIPTTLVTTSMFFVLFEKPFMRSSRLIGGGNRDPHIGANVDRRQLDDESVKIA